MRHPERKAVCDILANGKTSAYENGAPAQDIDLSQFRKQVAELLRTSFILKLPTPRTGGTPMEAVLRPE
jgi:hypothetical protein